MSNFDGGPGSGPKPGQRQSAYEGPMEPKEPKPAKPERQKAYEGPMEPKGQRDVSNIKPATGPMSSAGPNGTSEGLPKTVEPDDHKSANDAGKECGGPMSLDKIKGDAKKLGGY